MYPRARVVWTYPPNRQVLMENDFVDLWVVYLIEIALKIIIKIAD